MGLILMGIAIISLEYVLLLFLDDILEKSGLVASDRLGKQNFRYLLPEKITNMSQKETIQNISLRISQKKTLIACDAMTTTLAWGIFFRPNCLNLLRISSSKHSYLEVQSGIFLRKTIKITKDFPSGIPRFSFVAQGSSQFSKKIIGPPSISLGLPATLPFKASIIIYNSFRNFAFFSQSFI